MGDSQYKKIARLIDKSLMIWILYDMLEHSEIVNLCNACSISYNGTRTKSISPKQLVSDLAEEFYENEGSARIITKTLKKTSGKVMKTLANLSFQEISNLIHEAPLLFPEEKHGNLVFALACDHRPVVNSLIEKLGEELSARSIRLSFEKEDASDETEVEDKIIDEEILEELTRTNKKLTQDIGKITPQLTIVETERDELLRRVEALDEERKILKKTINELQKELGSSQKINKFWEEENNKLRKALEKASLDRERGDTSNLFNQLVRENRKIRYDLDKFLDRKNDTDVSVGTFVERIENEVGEIKQVLTDLVATKSRGIEEIKRMIEDVSNEVHTYHIENRKFKESFRSIDPTSRSAKTPNELTRVGVFVDVQNIFYAARQFNSRLDFEKLLQAAVGERRLVRAIAYVVQSPEVDQTNFVSMLQQKNYEVKRKDLRLRSDGSAKGDWDMGIAIDVISSANKLDVVVLVSGDGDFVALVNLIKTMGPKIEIFSFLHNTARDLVQAADEYYPIDESMLLKASP